MTLTRKTLIAALCAAAVATAGALTLRPAVTQTAGVSVSAPADAQTTAIVAAAQAFLTTLDEAQRAAVVYDRSDQTQRANWSNLPIDMVTRGGLAWGDMSDAQRAALTGLLGTVLSPDGLTMVQRQMAADEVLRNEAETAGGRRLTFGSDYYYVSFLGEPTQATVWTMQFGGHHLALNATVAGPEVTLAPSLTGGQPLRLTMDGQQVWIVEAEVTAAAALMASLDDAQKAVAVQGDTSIDLVLGPGEDGQSIDPVGLSATDMSPEQQGLLTALIGTRIGILNDDDRDAAMAEIEAGLAETTFGWWGPADDAPHSYWRVTGPRIVMEFSGQSMGGDTAEHTHNMYRDPANDYGAAWTAQN